MKKKSALMLIVLIVLLQACGGGGGGETATPDIITIQAIDFTVTTIEDAPVQFDVKVSNMDISALTCAIKKIPSHGTINHINGTTWEYTPYDDFSGIDTLEYSLSKGTNKSNTATVTITVETTGNIIYVTPDGLEENDGSSWAEALRHPQDAMDKAIFGEQIWVAKGTYYDTGQNAATPVLAMKDGVRIYGGFSGTEVYRSERNISLNASILDGQKKVYHVVKGAPSSRIDGFTIQNGNARIDNNPDPLILDPEETGGGMLNVNCEDKLIISNCSFIKNNSKGYGGGVTNQQNSSPKIINCQFTDNNAYYGGGIFNSDGTPYITNCVFQGNNAYRGGAIMNRNASLSLVNCTISGNNASLLFLGGGGALYNESSFVSVINCIIWGNTDNEFFNNGSPPMEISSSCIFGGATGTGNITKNPQFVITGYWDVGNEWIPGNYRLKDTSPCIDAADGDSAPLFDIETKARFDMLSVIDTGTGIISYSDMGAYEYIQ